MTLPPLVISLPISSMYHTGAWSEIHICYGPDLVVVIPQTRLEAWSN